MNIIIRGWLHVDKSNEVYDYYTCNFIIKNFKYNLTDQELS